MIHPPTWSESGDSQILAFCNKVGNEIRVQHSGYYFIEFSASAQLSDLYCYNSIFSMQWREKMCSCYQPSCTRTSNKSLLFFLIPRRKQQPWKLPHAIRNMEMNPFSFGTWWLCVFSVTELTWQLLLNGLEEYLWFWLPSGFQPFSFASHILFFWGLGSSFLPCCLKATCLIIFQKSKTHSLLSFWFSWIAFLFLFLSS